MDADPKATVLNPEDESPSRRQGIGLCLSGGGFRATLFHLGAIRRLFELGITARPDFKTVASVSGGSLTAAQWAIGAVNAQANGRALDFQTDIASRLHAVTAMDIRSGAMAKKYLLPWNWFRGQVAVESMISRFESLFPFQGRTLADLPETPLFVLCGADMAFGKNFVFERTRVGSYRAGYAPPTHFTLAQAVAASACFPPLFGPLRIEGAADLFKGGSGPPAEERRKILADLRVTDGGVYDNLGLEPVWKKHRVVLVSDAGGLMDAEADKNLIWRIQRYQSIQEAQARATRKRLLFAGLTQKDAAMRGAYIGVGGSFEKYAGAVSGGYSKKFATEVIANIRTDLDAFSDVERGVLENHGYALMDAAIRTHVPELLGSPAAFVLPFPALAPPAIAEEELRRRLFGSEKRKLTGRG